MIFCKYIEKLNDILSRDTSVESKLPLVIAAYYDFYIEAKAAYCDLHKLVKPDSYFVPVTIDEVKEMAILKEVKRNENTR